MTDPVTPSAPDSIRRARQDDRDTLVALGRETFLETWIEGYRMPYAPDDVAAFLDGTFAPALIATRLADSAYAYWLVERGGEAVGYALAGPCSLPYAEVLSTDGELKQIYLRRVAQGGGAGGALLDAALVWLEREGPRRLWLGVWSGNVAAQRFYERRGFRKFGEHTYTVGRTVDEEFAMVRDGDRAT